MKKEKGNGNCGSLKEKLGLVGNGLIFGFFNSLTVVLFLTSDFLKKTSQDKMIGVIKGLTVLLFLS